MVSASQFDWPELLNNDALETEDMIGTFG